MAEVVTERSARGRPAVAVAAQHRSFARTAVLLPAGLGLAALLVRLYGLTHESLWLDEGYTLLFSGLPMKRVLLVGGAHEHPPLYYTIVHALLVIHNSYLMARGVSAVAGALSVVVLYLLGARLFGRLAGTVAAGLLLSSPFHVWYSHDARGYELAGLAVLLSYLCLFAALDVPRPIRWALYAIACAACLYAEYTTVFVLLPQLLLLVRARQQNVARSMILAWVAAGLLFAPWIGTLALNVAAIAGDYWIPPPTPDVVAGTALEFLGLLTPCPFLPCAGTESGLPLLAGHELIVGTTLGLIVVVGGGIAAVRRDLIVGMLVLWLTCPFAIVLVLALRRSLYLDRVFLDATFPLYLLGGLAVARAFSRPRTWAVPAACVLLSGAAAIGNLKPIYANEVNPDWKSAVRDFAAAYRPGQVVVFNPGVLRSLVAAYLPDGWHATYERPLWSRTYVDVPGWQDRFHFSAQASKLVRQRDEARLRDEEFRDAVRHGQQVWLVTFDYSGMNDTRRWFADHGFQLVLGELYTGDTRIELWERSGPASFGRSVTGPDTFTNGWQFKGTVSVGHGIARLGGPASLIRMFAVRPGAAYSVSSEFRGIPPASKPLVTVDVYDSAGRNVGEFPRDQWYDWPVNDVWLSQPLGFVAPPGAVRAVLRIGQSWGEGRWRHVAVYRQP